MPLGGPGRESFPHRRRSRLELDVELLLRPEPVLRLVAHASGEMQELVGVQFREVEVLRRPPQHPQAVDELTEEHVRLRQSTTLLVRDDAGGAQLLESSVDARRLQLRILRRVEHLQELDRVLQIDESSRAVLRVVATGFATVLVLAHANLVDLLRVDVPRRIGELVAQSFDACAEIRITRDGAHAHERETFDGVRVSADAVVRAERLETARVRTVLAVRSQAQVDLEDALALGADQLGQVERHFVEELGVRAVRLAVGTAVVAVDEEDLDIRRVAESAATQLPEAEDRPGSLQPRDRQRASVALDEAVPDDLRRDADDLFG